MFLYLTLYLVEVYTKYLRIFSTFGSGYPCRKSATFLFTKTINTTQKERGIRNDQDQDRHRISLCRGNLM